MPDTALNLTARLKQPLAPFETPLAPWFEELIEPIYDCGEQVVQEHTAWYLELVTQLHSRRRVSDMIDWLEAQRTQQLSLRLAVRMLEMREDVTPCQLGRAVAQFRRGMVGLMQGCVALVEPDSSRWSAYPHGGPTVLGLLHQAAQAPMAERREQCLETAKQQFNAFKTTWEDAVEAFASIKVHCRQAARQTASSPIGATLGL